MKVIHKYVIHRHADVQTLDLPVGSKILSAKAQYGKIVIYALVDFVQIGLQYKAESYQIHIVGTGFGADSILRCTFLDTVKLLDGTEMWHVFYKKVDEDEQDKKEI